jgi:hypothetical protein
MHKLLATLMLFSACSAQALTIDFDSLTEEQLGPLICCDIHRIGYSLDVDGFNFYNAGHPSGTSPYGLSAWGTNHHANADPGGYTLKHSYAQSTTIMTAINGSVFDVVSMDVTDIFNRDWDAYDPSEPLSYPSLPGPISIWADLAGGGTVSTTFSIDIIQGLETINLNWTGVTALYFRNDSSNSNASFQADNIVVNAVPVPAAVWLFGSGLGLLGWFRHRQTA